MALIRTKARKDANHKKIVEGLRKFGASVLDVSQLKNCFDILVGYNGLEFIMEIKDGNKPRSSTKLTKGELKFKQEWKGSEYHVVYSLEEAIKTITYDNSEMNKSISSSREFLKTISDEELERLMSEFDDYE